jgi:opacity protein-like surface antigen
MAMRITTIVVGAVVASVTASPAAAQVRMNQQGSGRPISVAFGGGASVPIGTYKDALKAGWNGQGSLIFNLGAFPLALRADLNYNQFTFKSGLPFTPGGTPGGTFTTTDDITQQILGGLANVTIPFSMGPITPYVTAGVAGFNIKTKLGSAVPGAEDESDTKFAVNGGAGLSIRLLGASAFIEAKVNNVYTDKKFISNQELKALQFIPVTFGFVF